MMPIARSRNEPTSGASVEAPLSKSGLSLSICEFETYLRVSIRSDLYFGVCSDYIANRLFRAYGQRSCAKGFLAQGTSLSRDGRSLDRAAVWRRAERCAQSCLDWLAEQASRLTGRAIPANGCQFTT